MKTKSLNPPRVILRTDQKAKDGKCSVILRIIIHNSKKDISLRVYCLERYFDKTNNRVKKSCPNSTELNLLIDSGFKRANDIIFNARVNYLPLTMDDFNAKYNVLYKEPKELAKELEIADFYKFVESEIELEKKKADKSQYTLNRYGYDLEKLKKFRSKLTFDEITETFLADLVYHEMEVLKNEKNSANNRLKFIKKFLYVAIKKKLTTNNPFVNFKIKYEEKNDIKHLKLFEVKKLQDYFATLEEKHRHYRALKSFLFSCYTGLRYGDNSKFTLNDMEGNNIRVRTEKTKVFVVVPLLSYAKGLLNYEIAPSLPNLSAPSNQKCNDYLKEIAKKCGIDKAISTHYARHTFACIALNSGIDRTIIQAFLGHTTSKQTDHYAKLFDETKTNAMAKLEGVF